MFSGWILQFTSFQILPVSLKLYFVSNLFFTNIQCPIQADADILSCFVFVVNSSTILSISTCSRRSMCVLTHHVGDYSVCRSNCFVMQNTIQVHTQLMFSISINV